MSGEKITVNADHSLNVPNHPIIPYIEGDGIGVDIWPATQHVLDEAIRVAYNGEKKIEWKEILAGEKAFEATGEWLPKATTDAIAEYKVAIKGPLTTPIGGGIRSLNVSLRKILDLYACIRPVRYFNGVPSPMKAPEKLDVVLFRENTEDVYAGIEWEQGSEDMKRLITLLKDNFDVELPDDCGVGLKPMSLKKTERLVRQAVQYAIDNNLPTVTLVHKGNIMKYTEGAFKEWGYALAAREFAEQTITEDDVWKNHGGKTPAGKVMIQDRIADAMFQQLLLRPDEYSVIACPNLNGDYLSDACAAQVGGLGIAPGGNIGDGVALFEATHGTAPKYAGQDKVNPGSLILSGVMMLTHLGWTEAADLIVKSLEKAIDAKTVTYDLERQMDGATLVSCSGFGKAIASQMTPVSV